MHYADPFEVFAVPPVSKHGGIYKLDFGSGNFYVGSAVNFCQRWCVHRHHFKKGTHNNVMLARAYVKYGEERLSFSIIEIVADRSQLIAREQFWMDLLNPPYNICRVASSMLGFKQTDKTVAKMRINATGRIKSEISKAQWRATMKTRGHFDKFADLCRGRVGRIASAETRARQSAALMGRIISPEMRRKISATKKAQGYRGPVFTDAIRKVLSEKAIIREAAKRERNIVKD